LYTKFLAGQQKQRQVVKPLFRSSRAQKTSLMRL